MILCFPAGIETTIEELAGPEGKVVSLITLPSSNICALAPGLSKIFCSQNQNFLPDGLASLTSMVNVPATL